MEKKNDKKWKTKLDNNFQIDFLNSISLKDLENISWEEQNFFKGIQKSDRGTEVNKNIYININK